MRSREEEMDGHTNGIPQRERRSCYGLSMPISRFGTDKVVKLAVCASYEMNCVSLIEVGGA